MAQIAFKPSYCKGKKQPSENITNAAWQFAYAALWQEQQFYPNEIESVKQEIRGYFSNAGNEQDAFTAFCERIIIANRLLAGERCRLLPHPSIWFNRHYKDGFAATMPLREDIKNIQAQIPGFCESIQVVAKSYWHYTQQPSGKTFQTCRKKLLRLKEYGLIQLFYNSIIYSQLLNPAK